MGGPETSDQSLRDSNATYPCPSSLAASGGPVLPRKIKGVHLKQCFATLAAPGKPNTVPVPIADGRDHRDPGAAVQVLPVHVYACSGVPFGAKGYIRAKSKGVQKERSPATSSRKQGTQHFLSQQFEIESVQRRFPGQGVRYKSREAAKREPDSAVGSPLREEQGATYLALPHRPDEQCQQSVPRQPLL